MSQGKVLEEEMYEEAHGCPGCRIPQRFNSKSRGLLESESKAPKCVISIKYGKKKGGTRRKKVWRLRIFVEPHGNVFRMVIQFCPFCGQELEDPS